MEKINFRDFFDFADGSELEKAINIINQLDKEYSKLQKHLKSDAKRISDAFGENTVSLQDLEAALKKVNITSAEQQKMALKLAAAAEKQAAAQEALRKAQEGNVATQKIYENSIDGLRKKAKDLTTELERVVKAQEPEKFRQLATAINETKAEAEALKLAARGVVQQFDAAKGSYNALLQENKKLHTELKNIEGGMNGTNARAEELKKQIYENTATLKAFDKELNQTYRNVGNYAEGIIQAKEQLDKNRAALTAQVQALQAQLSATKNNAEMQNKIQTELKQTNSELYSVNQQLKVYGDNALTAEQFSDKLRGGLRRVALETVGAYVGFQALKEGISNIIEKNAEMSDAQADVQKTTGLSKDAVNSLTNSLAKIDTRTAVKELLTIATIGGQMGVAQTDIEGFTQAIDQANIALGDEFSGGAEEIATALAKINNVYGTSRNVGLEKGLMNIGSAVNELGAQGAATSPYLTDFALRVGAVSKNAGLGLEKVLGYGAALEELGVPAEVAGTAFSKLVAKMSSNSKSFFDVAKMGDANLSLKEFQKLVNTDVNAALQAFLKGMNAGGSSTIAFSELVKDLKLDGQGASSVLTLMAKNTDLVTERQKVASQQLADGTSLTKEAETKNNTLAGSVAKLKKEYEGLFTSNELQSYLKNAIDGFLQFAAGIKTVFQGVKENKDVLFGMIPIMVGIRSTTVAAAVAEKGWAASLGITRMAYLRNIVAIRAWTASMLANPIGLVIVALTALFIAFNRLEKNSERNIELQKMTNDINAKAEKAITKVSEAQKLINEQVQNYNALSPAEQANLRAKIEGEKKLALAMLMRLEVERQSAIKKAAEINAYDQIKASVLSAGNAYAFTATIMEGQSGRMQKANGETADAIKRLKDSILGFDTEIKNINATAAEKADKDAADAKAKAEAAAEAAKKASKAAAELQMFRLEQQAKALDYFAEQQKKANEKSFQAFEQGVITAEQHRDAVVNTGFEIAQAQREAAQKRIQIALVEKNILLSNEKLIGDERKKIVEEYAAKVNEIEQGLSEKLGVELALPKPSSIDFTDYNKSQDEQMKKDIKRMQDAHEKYKQDQEDKTKTLEEEAEKRKKIQDASFELAAAAGDALFELNSMKNDQKLAQLQAQTEHELAVAGDNEEAKQRIRENAEKKEKELRIKQAKADKLRALFGIAINTAQAVAESVAASPLTFGLPWSAFALANGAIQAGLVLAQPLPQYFKGRENGPAEFAIVDEKGPELIKRKDKFFLGQNNGPRLTHLGAGDKVYTADQTSELLNDILAGNEQKKFLGTFSRSQQTLEAAQQTRRTDASASISKQLSGYFRKLEKTIKGKKEVQLNITKEGISMLTKEGNTWIKYADERYTN